MRRFSRALLPLVRPPALAALAVLAVNDHLLKESALAGVVTGKLSDVAGLFLLPVLATVVTRGMFPKLARHAAAAWCVGTAIAFVLLKLDPRVNAFAAHWWGMNTLDPTDLLALPAVALAWIWLRRTEPAAETPRWTIAFGRVAVVAVAGGVCIATPAAPRPPPRPFVAWTVTSNAGHEAGCGRARAWVSKSGKTGIGLTLRLENPNDREPCTIPVPVAALEIAGRAVRASVVEANPPAGDAGVVLDPCRTAYVYYAFELDNEASWNRGERDARFLVALATTSGTATWEIPAEHRTQTPEHHTRGGSPQPDSTPWNPCARGGER